uniref:Uncharacterized protein n=1 Tax=Schlesneria paludicola TaxID=360056 RepID=A0A7C2K1L2_9PLAN
MTDGDDHADVAPLKSTDDFYLIPMLHWATRISPEIRALPRTRPCWLDDGKYWESDSHPADDSLEAISEWFQLWIGVCGNFDSPTRNAYHLGRSPRRLAGMVIRDAWRIADHLKDSKGESFSDLPPCPLPKVVSTYSCADAKVMLSELFRQIKQAFQVKSTKASSSK